MIYSFLFSLLQSAINSLVFLTTFYFHSQSRDMSRVFGDFFFHPLNMQTFKITIYFLIILIVCVLSLDIANIGNLNIKFINLVNNDKVSDVSSQIGAERVNPLTLEVSFE